MRKDTPNEVAIQESINTRFGVDRCLKYAFELTKKEIKTTNLLFAGRQTF
jgi:3-isopropylmalate dehydrogenase